jgi:hypothetical protein
LVANPGVYELADPSAKENCVRGQPADVLGERLPASLIHGSGRVWCRQDFSCLPSVQGPYFAMTPTVWTPTLASASPSAHTEVVPGIQAMPNTTSL